MMVNFRLNSQKDSDIINFIKQVEKQNKIDTRTDAIKQICRQAIQSERIINIVNKVLESQKQFNQLIKENNINIKEEDKKTKTTETIIREDNELINKENKGKNEKAENKKDMSDKEIEKTIEENISPEDLDMLMNIRNNPIG